MDFEKALEEHLKKNKEMRELFEKHPERKAMYIEKLKDTWGERTGYTPPNPEHYKWCRTCAFSHGAPPFEDRPEKAYCGMYPRSEGVGKPEKVRYGETKCIYYEKEQT